MFPGVLVEFLAPAEDCPVVAGVLLGRGHEAQGMMAVCVVVGVDVGACPLAGASEVDGTFRQPQETEPSGGRVEWYFAVRNRASA